MRFTLSLISLVVLGVNAHAMPAAPWPFAPDETQVILATTVIHPTTTCKEMMRMHKKMMGGKA